MSFLKKEQNNVFTEKLKPSATLQVNELSSTLVAQGKQVFRFGFGQSPFPVPNCVVEALQKNAFQKDYLPVKGLLTLRQAVASHQSQQLNQAITADQILIGPGSKELIFNLQMAFDSDLLLPSPSWVSYEPQAHILNKKIWTIETYENENWLLSPQQLDLVCQQVGEKNKLLILNYPNNPTGASFSSAQLKELAIILKKNNVLVLVDEIYAKVSHSHTHSTLAHFYPEGTIISGGLSKWCGAGGWRLGVFTFPPNLLWIANTMATIASETYSAVSAPIQYAAIEAYTNQKKIEKYLKKSNDILAAIGKYVYKSLKQMHIQCTSPMGGFYLFPNFEYYRLKLKEKGIHTSEAWCAFLLEKTGIALLPGTAFGRPSEELTTRLAYVDFDGEQALKYYRSDMADEDFMNQYCPKIKEALNRLHQFLNTF